MSRSTLFTFFITLLISACATTPAPTESPASDKDQATSTSAGTTAQAVTSAATPEAQPATSAMQAQTTPAESIYFDKDKFNITAEYQPVVQQQAEALKQNGKPVTLEGNADERGSSEYNLALGDRRANAVRKSLQILGIPSERIRVISFGEEKPRKTCHEESCWHENRRVDFRY